MSRDGAFLALMKREEHLETRQVCFKPITDVTDIEGERKAMGKMDRMSIV